MDHRRLRSAFQGTSSRDDQNCSEKKALFDRLSTPKCKDKRWIPDRPSVYWLDYLIDPTPHTIKDPEKLASYYDNFEPQFPRMKLLSAPRPYYGTLRRDDDESNKKPISRFTGIPISALTYNASDRIKDLARPKTSVLADNAAASLRPRPIRTSRHIEMNSTERSYSPKGKEQYFDPNVDFARGDFPSRSKHTIHANSYNGKKRVVARDADRDEAKNETFLLHSKTDDVPSKSDYPPSRSIQNVFRRLSSQDATQARTNVSSKFRNEVINKPISVKQQGMRKSDYVSKNCPAYERPPPTKDKMIGRHLNSQATRYGQRRKEDNIFTARNPNMLSSRPSNNFNTVGNSGTITRDILRNDKKQPMMSRTLYSGRH